MVKTMAKSSVVHELAIGLQGLQRINEFLPESIFYFTSHQLVHLTLSFISILSQ